jgi:hypothetical protein
MDHLERETLQTFQQAGVLEDAAKEYLSRLPIDFKNHYSSEQLMLGFVDLVTADSAVLQRVSLLMLSRPSQGWLATTSPIWK